jgi:hypothetical protein
MSLRSFNPDGGDLGMPDPIREDEDLFVHIAKAAKLLTLVQALADVSGMADTRFCYGFRIPLSIVDRDFQMKVRNIVLPIDVTWYSCDGKSLFEVRGPSGGVATSKVAYLVTIKRN